MVIAGSIASGATTSQIASSTIWNEGKHIMSLSPQGSALFFLLGTSVGFVATLAVLSSKPPEWVNARRLGPSFVTGCALFVSCLAGAFAFVGWCVASAALPNEFYRFVFK